MSSFLSRFKSQFSSSSSCSPSQKKSSPTATSPASSTLSPAPFTRQSTIPRKPPLPTRTSSSYSNGSASPSRNGAPQLYLLDLDVATIAQPALEDEALKLKEKEKEILSRSQWSSDEVAEFVALCAKKMKERDMSTPGLFLPHGVPSSLKAQQTLLVLFLRLRQPSLFPPPPPTSSLTLTPPTPAYLFETELKYISSVHDLASCVRFAICHLVPHKERAEWYASFAMWEVERAFEPNVWVQMGGMNESVLKLMSVVEELLMGAAARIDKTGVGAAGLSKLVGFWLLRDGTEANEGGGEVIDLVRVFERLGRKMEHATLAYIRYQSQLGQIPTRLLPFVEGYPFGSVENRHHFSATPLLGPPPYTTRPFSVLHVRIRASSFPETSRKPDPVFLAEQAFRGALSRSAKNSEEASLWKSITSRVRIPKEESEDGRLDLAAVFDAETIRAISIIEDLYPSRPTRTPLPAPPEPMYRPFHSPTLNGSSDQLSLMRSLSRPSHNRKRSMSHSDIKLLASVDELAGSSTTPSVPTLSEFGMRSTSRLDFSPPFSSSPSSSNSWAEFSSLGFGESRATERSSMQIGEGFSLRTKSSPKRLTARSPQLSRILAPSPSPASTPTTPNSTKERATAGSTAEIETLDIIEVDETFYEFTQDVLLDPGVAAGFPVWAMYALSTLPSLDATSPSPFPSWLLISIASTPKATPLTPPPVVTVQNKPAVSERRTASSPAKPGEESTTPRRAKRMSFLGIGMGSLGRRKSLSSSSTLMGGERPGVTSPLPLSTKSSTADLGVKNPPDQVVPLGRSKSKDVLLSSAPPVSVRKVVIPPVVTSTPTSEVIEIGHEKPPEAKNEAVGSPEVVVSPSDPVEALVHGIDAETESEPKAHPAVADEVEPPQEEATLDELIPSMVSSTIPFSLDAADPNPFPLLLDNPIDKFPSSPSDLTNPTQNDSPDPASTTVPTSPSLAQHDPTEPFSTMAPEDVVEETSEDYQPFAPLVPDAAVRISAVEKEASSGGQDKEATELSPAGVSTVLVDEIPPVTLPLAPIVPESPLTVNVVQKEKENVAPKETDASNGVLKSVEEITELVVDKVQETATGAAAGVVGMLQEVRIMVKSEGNEPETVEHPNPVSPPLPTAKVSPQASPLPASPPFLPAPEPNPPLDPPTLLPPTFLFTDHSSNLPSAPSTLPTSVTDVAETTTTTHVAPALSA